MEALSGYTSSITPPRSRYLDFGSSKNCSGMDTASARARFTQFFTASRGADCCAPAHQREGRSVRRMYSATAKGRRTSGCEKGKVRELFGEVLEDEEVK